MGVYLGKEDITIYTISTELMLYFSVSIYLPAKLNRIGLNNGVDKGST